MKLTFLGTGGGRFSMIKQLRRTGGIFLEDSMKSEISLDRANSESSSSDGFSCVIDPAPGALVRARESGIELEELDAVIVSHAHLDHHGDMAVMIEAMTEGGKKQRGKLLCAESVLDGAEIPGKYVEGGGTYGEAVPPALDPYHESLVGEVVRLKDGKELGLGPYAMECIETEHSDPRTVAFTLEKEGFSAGFVTDTELFEGLNDFFSGCDALVVNMMRPHDREWKGHLNTADAAELLNAVEPELAVLQHFGAALIYSSVKDEEEWLEERTGMEFVMAEDGMEIDLENPERGLERFT